MTDHTPTAWESKAVGLAALTIITLRKLIVHVPAANPDSPAVWFSTRWTLRLSNTLGVLKLVTLLLIIIPGFVALGGGYKAVPDPKANFRNAFDGASNNGYQLSNALVSIIFSYGMSRAS